MRPEIVQQSDVSGAALVEFKAWLGISRPNEDALLINLLQASVATCEEAISLAPLEKIVEIQLPASSGWHCFAVRPVRSLIQVEAIADDGTRTILSDQESNLVTSDTDAARFFAEPLTDAQRIAVQISVGIAEQWSDVPPALKQGIIRLAAFYFRERDRGDAKPSALPASITALWQPWRDLRLS